MRSRGTALLAAAIVTLAVAAPLGASVTRDQFMGKTAGDLIAICGAAEDDPMKPAALGFCHGYAVAVWQYHQALTARGRYKPIVCLPPNQPTRAEMIAMYVDWGRANPQYLPEPAIETVFKFLTEKFPCPAEGGAGR